MRRARGPTLNSANKTGSNVWPILAEMSDREQMDWFDWHLGGRSKLREATSQTVWEGRPGGISARLVACEVVGDDVELAIRIEAGMREVVFKVSAPNFRTAVWRAFNPERLHVVLSKDYDEA